MNHNGTAGADREGRLSEVLADWLEAAERGAPPEEGEYLRRYPEFAAELAECFADWKRFPRPGGRLARPLAAVEPPLPKRGQLGDFRILREVGRGGMGVVYEAEQESLGRRVALKVLPGQAGQDPRLLARFRRECRAAAQLHHTNIVPVFEVGEWRAGEGSAPVHYYAMQFIPGQALDQVLQELQCLRSTGPGPVTQALPADAGLVTRSLWTGQFQPAREDPPPPQADALEAPAAETEPVALDATLSSIDSNYRLYCRKVARLGLQVAEALAYAHGRGIIHRDIKPANLLLDSTGVLWVSDFGLVKTQDPALTDTGDLVGTLRYMAPERFRGECDARADVYALGLTLYELLVLRPAFDGQDRMQLVDQIGSQEPPRLRVIDPRIPRDLETILMKAIEKEPRRRYPSAEALASDLRRFLADEPIQARRIGPLERLWRWGRRNPLVAGLSAAVLLVALGGFLGVLGQWQAAVAHQKVAEENAKQAWENEREANKQRDDARDFAEQLRATQAELKNTLYAAHMNLAQHAWAANNVGLARELLEKYRPKLGESDLRNFEWRYLYRLCHPDLLTLQGHTGEVTSVVFSPDGKRLATATGLLSDRGEVKVWDAQTGQELLSIQDAGPNVAFSPDGKRLASGDGMRALPPAPGVVKVWDAQTGQELLPLKGHRTSVASVAFSPDGKYLASAAANRLRARGGEVKVWDAQTGEELRTFQGDSCVSFSPDGKRLASASTDNTVKVWDAQTGKELHTLKEHTHPVNNVSFSPDGKRLASASGDFTVKVWDAQAGQELFTLKGHANVVNSVAYSPDGKRLASASWDKTVKVWDAQTGQELLSFKGHTDLVTSVSFSPDGKRLASASTDKTVKVWDAQADQKPLILKKTDTSVRRVTFSPDGKRLASASEDNTVKVWDTQTGQELFTLKGGSLLVDSINGGPQGSDEPDIAFSPDGKRLACGGQPGKVWDAQTGKELFTFSTDRVRSVAFSPDGKCLASTSARGMVGRDGVGNRVAELKLWDAQTGKELLILQNAEISVVFSPDGKRLASASGDNTVKVWDAQTGQELLARKHMGPGVRSVAFSPDGKRLVIQSVRGNTVELWDAQTGQQILTFKEHTFRVWRVVFSPDGKRLASIGGHRGPRMQYPAELKVWDAQTGQELFTLQGHANVVLNVAFSPDGERLASSSLDKTVKVWDMHTGQELLTLQSGASMGVTFSPDGHRLACIAEDGVKIWDATPLPAKP
jgi:WD40 repeat protein/serine/threonine protein kinase